MTTPSADQHHYALTTLIRLANANLTEKQTYALYGRLLRLPGVAQEIQTALDETGDTDA